VSDDHRWVERQLADLPAQPMPDSVRDRLDSAIAGAALTPAVPRQQGDPEAASVPAGSQPTRPRHRWLLAAGGVAAALALVMAVDPFLLRDSDGETFDTATEPIAEESSAGMEAATGDGTDAGTVATAPAVPSESEMVVASGTTYTRQQLEGQTQQTLQGRSVESRRPPAAAAAPAAGDEASAAPAASAPADPMACVSALPGEGELQFVDQAGFEGEAALVTARLVDGVIEVFVQDPTCTADDPAVRYRATVGAPGQPGAE